MNPSSSPFDFCARCGHARANHGLLAPKDDPGAHLVCLFTACGCHDFVAPLELEQLRELRRRLARECIDARRQAAGHDDDGHTRQAAEYRGFGDGLDRAIALLDELVPGAKP